MEAAELRPMSLGEILDRTFTLYRNHFLLFIGIMMVPYLFQLVINLANGAMQSGTSIDPSSRTTAVETMGVAFSVMLVFVGFVLFVLAYSIAHAAAAFAVSNVYLGRPASVRESFARVRGRMARAVNVMLSIWIRIIGAFLLVVFPIGFLGALMFSLGTPMGVFAVIPIAILVFLVPAILLLCRYSLAIPAAMLEDIKTRPAIRRSIVLVKGSYGRVFLIFLLVLILSYVAVLLFQLPILMAIAAASLKGEQPGWLLTIAGLAAFVGSTLVGPIGPIAFTLIYYDERIRKEAFDLQLMMQMLDGAVPSPGSTPPLADAGGASVPRQFS